MHGQSYERVNHDRQKESPPPMLQHGNFNLSVQYHQSFFLTGTFELPVLWKPSAHQKLIAQDYVDSFINNARMILLNWVIP